MENDDPVTKRKDAAEEQVSGPSTSKAPMDSRRRSKGILEAAKKMLSEGTKAVREEMADATGRSLRIDRARKTLSISDEAFIKGLLHLAGTLAPDARITIEARPTGFQVGAKLKGGRASALLELDRVTLAGGVVSVRARTPEGVDVQERSLLVLFAAMVARLFGGTWIGLKLLGTRLPPNVTWDGAVATVSADLARVGKAPAELAFVAGVASVTKRDGWTAFKVDRVGVIDALMVLLLRTLGGLLTGT